MVLSKVVASPQKAITRHWSNYYSHDWNLPESNKFRSVGTRFSPTECKRRFGLGETCMRTCMSVIRKIENGQRNWTNCKVTMQWWESIGGSGHQKKSFTLSKVQMQDKNNRSPYYCMIIGERLKPLFACECAHLKISLDDSWYFVARRHYTLLYFSWIMFQMSQFGNFASLFENLAPKSLCHSLRSTHNISWVIRHIQNNSRVAPSD